jgi:hypothetical protein
VTSYTNLVLNRSSCKICKKEIIRSGREADRSVRSSGQIKNVWSSTFTPPLSYLARCLSKHRGNFTYDFLYSDSGLIFSRLPKMSLCHLHAVCVSVYPSFQRLIAWTNLYETWYVYHGTWAHLSGVLHKSLPSLCVSYMYPSFHCQETAR